MEKFAMRIKKIAALVLAIVLLLSVTALAVSVETLDGAVTDAAAFMLKTVEKPEVGSVGGEWAVIGLARSGYAVPESYYRTYYATVEKYVTEYAGVLHSRKYTEYSRVILALTAAGYDPRSVAGYDLTAPLEDFDKTIWQGMNGPIWALIALDSGGYANSRRAEYLQYILDKQETDGGWNQAPGNGADADMTGMALQALARYQDNPDVKAATDRALECLSKLQDATGGYSTNMSGSAANVESAAQVLVALCSLGISVDDPRFVKNGYTLLDSILQFQNADGSFKHTADGSGDSQMSSEQALYGLVAAQRARDGKSALYDMSDAVKRGEFNHTETIGLPGKHADVKQVAVTKPGTTFEDTANHPNRSAIEALAAREIINGKGNGKFDPDGTVTRAEFAKMVALSLGLPEKTLNPFADVKAGAWYETSVATAYFYELVNGVGNDNFNPTGTITRQSAAAMVSRAAKLCGMDTSLTDAEIRDTLSQFGDYRSVADYAQVALAFCYSEGILDDSELEIQPTKSATRAEIAEMLYRLLGKANLL
jgi:hypothetical protein